MKHFIGILSKILMTGSMTEYEIIDVVGQVCANLEKMDEFAQVYKLDLSQQRALKRMIENFATRTSTSITRLRVERLGLGRQGSI